MNSYTYIQSTAVISAPWSCPAASPLERAVSPAGLQGGVGDRTPATTLSRTWPHTPHYTVTRYSLYSSRLLTHTYSTYIHYLPSPHESTGQKRPQLQAIVVEQGFRFRIAIDEHLIAGTKTSGWMRQVYIHCRYVCQVCIILSNYGPGVQRR